jgi:hypothetical protein
VPLKSTIAVAAKVAGTSVLLADTGPLRVVRASVTFCHTLSSPPVFALGGFRVFATTRIEASDHELIKSI